MLVLSNRRILVVEDEMLLMMMIEDVLTDAGCTLLTASRIPQAMILAETETIDCAILDVSVAGKTINPVADILTRRDIPFILSSGYGNAGLPAEYRDRPLLPKPYLPEHVSQAVAAALDA
jgi:CheY-like chemotaxis protein